MMHMFANCDNKMMQCSNPVDWKWWTLFWWMINVACTVLFTLEWVMRLFGALAASKVRQLFSDVFTYIDLATILPFYLNLMFSLRIDMRWLRVLRLSKVLRTLRIERLRNLAPVIGQILDESAGALLAPLFFLIIALVVFSAIVWHCERPYTLACVMPDGTRFDGWWPARTSPGNEGCMTDYGCKCAGQLFHQTYDGNEWSDVPFRSMPATWWFIIVTFTTVG